MARYQEYRLPAGKGLVHTHVRVRVMFIIEDSTMTAKAAFVVVPTDTICHIPGKLEFSK